MCTSVSEGLTTAPKAVEREEHRHGTKLVVVDRLRCIDDKYRVGNGHKNLRVHIHHNVHIEVEVRDQNEEQHEKELGNVVIP